MKPYYSDAWLTVYQGDARTVLDTLEPESVHCVVTSPPYWGLRDYGTASWEGGDPECPHRVPATGSTQNKGNNNREGSPFTGVCGECGARRIDAQLGLEATPEEYVAALVAVFGEVRRVLRADGTVWLNLGDTYSVGTMNGMQGPNATVTHPGNRPIGARALPFGLKTKDLVGIPWRVAFALQADGWYLRSDIIWAKPNPMPESVTDRPTKAHEYLFLLSKSPRYYFDADAVREPMQGEPHSPGNTAAADWRAIRGASVGKGMSGHLAEPDRTWGNSTGRNLRTVWTIATEPYPGAHFATFPRKLVEPCVKAGTSERGVCPECGAPWERETARALPPAVEPSDIDRFGTGEAGVHRKVGGEYQRWLDENPKQTTGWRSSCAHEAEPVPATVLDPFAGTGTTGLMAQSLSRRAVLIDLNADYLVQCLERNKQTPLGLVTA